MEKKKNRNENTRMVRPTVSIPKNVDVIIKDYVEAHPQFSISSFLVAAALEKLSRAKGQWLERVKRLDENNENRVSEEEFRSMSREQQWGVVRRLQG